MRLLAGIAMVALAFAGAIAGLFTALSGFDPFMALVTLGLFGLMGGCGLLMRRLPSQTAPWFEQAILFIAVVVGGLLLFNYSFRIW